MALKYWAKKFDNIILTGLPATGKSTFGRLYAYHSGRAFLDFDRYVEQQTKKSMAELFQEHGEEGFRKIEAKYLQKLRRHTHTVIALGGGTACQADTGAWEELVQPLGLSVFLKTPVTVLARRIWNGGQIHKSRPLFAKATTQAEVQQILENLWQNRAFCYNQATICLETDFYSVDNLKIQLSLWEKHPVHMGLIAHENKSRGVIDVEKSRNI